MGNWVFIAPINKMFDRTLTNSVCILGKEFQTDALQIEYFFS